MTLSEFLAARLGEDEANWLREKSEGAGADTPWMVDRMLREVAAKKKLLGLAQSAFTGMDSDDYSNEQRAEARVYGDLITQTLAAIWSDHPDYREDLP